MSIIAQCNNKIDIIEKELIESKQLVKYLITDAERVCLGYGKLQNKCSCSELRHDNLL